MSFVPTEPKVIFTLLEVGEDYHFSFTERFRSISVGELGITLGDVLRHAEKEYGLNAEEVADWIQKEVANPTEPLHGGPVN